MITIYKNTLTCLYFHFMISVNGYFHGYTVFLNIPFNKLLMKIIKLFTLDTTYNTKWNIVHKDFYNTYICFIIDNIENRKSF